MSSTPYDRQTGFALFSAENPLVPHSGSTLDAEFNAVKVAMDDTQQNLALIQDDDGALARGSVGQAQLDASISIGFGAPSGWTASTLYDADVDTVFHESKFYICIEDHTSGVSFEAEKWEEIADFTLAAVIDDGSITSAKLAVGAVTADKIGSGSISSDKLASGAVTANKIADASVTFDKLAPGMGASLASITLPVGLGPLPWTGRTAPAGWVLTGETYYRATYPALWAFASAEITAGNTLYGVGDGSTTFTIATMDGYAPVGTDASAARIAAITDVGDTAGAVSRTLLTANLPAYTPTGAITNGTINGGNAITGVATSPAIAGAGISVPNGTLASLSQGASTFTGDPQGGTSTAFSIIQPVKAFRFIIKAH